MTIRLDRPLKRERAFADAEAAKLTADSIPPARPDSYSSLLNQPEGSVALVGDRK